MQALMDSGIDYRGSNTGVYFAQLLTSTGELVDDRYDINNFHGLGKCIALRANRVSFTFDLRGPSLTVDTGERFIKMKISHMSSIFTCPSFSVLVCCYCDAYRPVCHYARRYQSGADHWYVHISWLFFEGEC